jgi:hypothetical protein
MYVFIHLVFFCGSVVVRGYSNAVALHLTYAAHKILKGVTKLVLGFNRKPVFICCLNTNFAKT